MPLAGNSDADVVLHALTNAISGLTGVNILGETADRLCLEEGITDSFQYLQAAMAEARLLAAVRSFDFNRREKTENSSPIYRQ